MKIRYTVKRDSLIGAFLTLVFVLSFIPYVTEVNTAMLLLGPISLIILSGIVLPIISPATVRHAYSALKRMRLLLLAFVIPVFPTVIAFSNGAWYSILYTLLMSVVLCSVQVLLAAISLTKIIRAFAQAGVICIWIFFTVDLKEIIFSAGSATRLIPYNAEPNAVGFIFAGFVAAIVGTLLGKQGGINSRLLYIVSAITASGMIFLASSRASLLALFLAAACVVFIYILVALKTRRLTKMILLSGFIVAIISIGIFLSTANSQDSLIEYTSKFLQLDSSYRGVGSGFSGRTTLWSDTLSAIASGGVWLFGSGYRTAGSDLGFSIDNGYLTIWYEAGLVGLLFVVGQMFWVLRFSFKLYFYKSQHDRKLFSLIIFSLVVVLFVNNIFDRYLFGYGNPFSILALFILLLNRQDLYRATAPSCAHRKYA